MKINIIRVILSILLLGTFYIIFGFSSQNAEQSSGISQKVSEIIINLFDNNKTQEEKNTSIGIIEPIIRKLAHFSIYTVVGCLLMGLCCTYNLNTKQKFIICLTIGFIYACSDELHQTFVNGRSGEIRDVLIDTSGCTLGITIVYNVWRIIKIRKKYTI